MKHFVVIGSSGALGGALTAQLAGVNGGRATVHALSRRETAFEEFANIQPGFLDITDEASVAAAAARVTGDPLDMVIVATGLLHDGPLQPEKSLRDLNPDHLQRVLAVNTMGPALVMKHFLPLLRRDRRAVFAALSARVGSISDNRLGGWHAYRASKAALNMLIKNAAIETARRFPEAMVVGLHPGTVDSHLSQPFQSSALHLFTPEGAASRLLHTLDQLTPADSGKCVAYDGAEVMA